MAEIHLTGRAASPGLAIGPVTVLTAAVARRTASGNPAQEAAALKAAIEGATAEIVKLIGTLEGEVADILEFQIAMLEDDALAEGAYDAISAGIPADHAWRSALDEEIAGYLAGVYDYDWNTLATAHPTKARPRVAKPGEATPPGQKRVAFSAVFEDGM